MPEPSRRLLPLLPALLLCLLHLCAHAPAGRAQTPGELARGVVIERVASASDEGQSYALYLPSKYTPDRKWPIIYAFDPVARGRVPVELLRAAAEAHGYIVAGSNNSQNGMQPQPLRTAINSMINDTRRRLSIDERRIYTAGFSGGARVASRVASSCDGCIAGVIACGAGFPSDIMPTKPLPFAYFATIGRDDYNYPELRRLGARLKELGVTHHVETFDGGHQWAPRELMSEAVVWLELQAMRAGRRERDERLIEQAWERANRALGADETAERWLETYAGYLSLASDFKGLKDVGASEQKAAALGARAEVKKALKEERAELEKQQELAGELIELGSLLLTEPSTRPATLKKLQTVVDELRRRAALTVDSSERRIARRTLRQVQAMTVEAAMFTYRPRGEYKTAIVNLEVASVVAPDNWLIPFELARAHALNGEKAKALAALRRAVEKGFPDRAAIERQKDFEALRAETEYQSILKQFEGVKPPK